MDADEITRIEATLLQDRGVGPQFREIVRHAREMHDILLRGRWSVAERVRGHAFGNATRDARLSGRRATAIRGQSRARSSYAVTVKTNRPAIARAES